ncbi:nodal modulator 1-like isoform X2 [Triticum dicoccoides]|uniref:nodal modulator 1-like isoform X2 n=1 Tax=Triticum dicoccoides TaxID=85692 RepID=UPI00189004F2|nr:nodal modulator 1-like isoform X2 [Triticum dicoccoides]
MDPLLPVLLLLSLAALSAASDEIDGCGGFVEASSGLAKSTRASESKFDYSDITVELCTVDGLVKESTQCAPNGYYFIPVYDKGSFIVRVKGPKGWSWKPETVPVVIDQNGCNGNADINFQFTGFTVSGKIVGAVGGKSCSKDGGPSGVKVELLSDLDELVASALTSSTGGYAFVNIIPGLYRLRASHPDYEIEMTGSSEVDLRFGNAVVDDVFFVSGYNIHGSVVAQGNPILGVHLYLYSNDVKEVPCSQGLTDAPREGALCHAVSGVDGKFSFRSMPCGSYDLLPYYRGENTVFDVSPSSLHVSLEHSHMTIPQKFQVTGFSVGGHVVDGYGAGIEGAKVIVDGQLRAVTDNLGYYRLDQVTSKKYDIVAEKDHYKFNRLGNFMILPNMESIDDIKSVRYDVCGVVQTVTPNSKAMVTLTHGPENVKPQRKIVSENGRFCFEVSTGEYRLSALPVDSEGSSNLLFSPEYIDVNVKCPLLDVEFSQSQVNVHGKILCKEKCNRNILLLLVRLAKGVEHETKTTSLEQDNANFVFTKVFPGKYRLEVKHSSSKAPANDDWCWDENTLDVDVGNDDVTNIVFVQKGYWIELVSSHDTEAYIRQPDSSKLELLIKGGSQRICIETPGQHELYLVNSCISFGTSPIVFDTQNPVLVHISAKKYLVRGEIHVDISSPLEEIDLLEDIVVDAFKSNGSSIDKISTMPVFAKSYQNGITVFEYSTWTDLGEDFIFVPRDSSTRRKKILFYPSRHQFSVSASGCQDAVPSITAKMGLYLEGSVSPATPDVHIMILAAGNSKYAMLKKGDIATETKTNSDGSFFAGPLYEDIGYEVEASKAGYHLKQTGPYSFACQKLGQILVHIYGENDTEMLPAVLLSLSGEGGYRKNSVSGSGGTFSFNNLFPRSYYLRALLKEYKFTPSTVAIDLNSGESRAVEFRATRVAFSAMGSVTLLTGQPKEGVFVEARSESRGYYEEATTDSFGRFRLRGLIPGSSYSIRVVAKDNLRLAALERASPESVSVDVDEDISGIGFVVFERPEATILSCHVEGNDIDMLQPHLSVEIRSAVDPSRIESVVPVPLSYHVEVRNLPKGKHFVQLRSGLPSHTHIFESELVEVDLEKQPQIHVGPLKYKTEERHHKQELTPAPVFPLIVGVSVVAVVISMPRLKDLYQSAVGMTSLSSGNTWSRKEPRKTILRKRA